MKGKNKPGDLQDLLQASPEELADWSQGVELESPESLRLEQDIVETWLQHESPANTPEPHKENGILRGLERWRAFWWVPVLSTATIFAIVFGLNTTWISPQDQLQPKGRRTLTTGTQSVSLQLGAWSLKTKKFSRVGDGETVNPSTALLFRITLRSPGHITLFVQTPRNGVQWLYPPPKGPTHVHPKGAFMLKIRGVVQRYTLDEGNGPYRFTLLNTSQPLSSSARTALKDPDSLTRLLRAHKHHHAQSHVVLRKSP